ncbi:MAG: ParB N-terminal domain-containing protein [Fibrobacter sp.]|nr:ParB N-terminal domain-containing protein [Fibrobacter sp.]
MTKHTITRELVDMPIESIKPYEHNPRKNEKAVEPLAQSIRANGFNAPIITDENGVILAGHTRHKAAKKLGLATVPVIIIRGLGENQKKAYRIADNKINELAKWDFSELDSEIEQIDWEAMEAEAEQIDWEALTEGEIEWPEGMKWDETALGFSETEAQALKIDADVGEMLHTFEGTSPVREREQRREEEEREQEQDEGEEREDRDEEDEDCDKVTFIAKGIYGDFGEDFWKLAGELYARGVKTETKWGKK